MVIKSGELSSASFHEAVFKSTQEKFGFCFITGVPPTPEATEKLSERIGFIRQTQCRFSLAS